MKKYPGQIKKIIGQLSLIAGLILPYSALAASSAYEGLEKVGTGGATGNAPYEAADQYKLAEIVGLVIKAFLGLLGMIFLVYTLYAGYNWMTAQGDEEKVTKAKDTIQRAVIGLIITIGAYAISFWVFHQLLTGTNIIAP